MMTHDEMIAVIQHHKNGGAVEYRQNGNPWKNASTPQWSFDTYDYRPKPEPIVIWVEVDSDNKPIGFYNEKPACNIYQRTLSIKKFIEVTE